MALLIWIPGTDGTLKNKGLLEIPTPAFSVPSENSGKLGKCLHGCTIYHFTLLPVDNVWSITCWAKLISGYSQYNNIILCLNSSDSSDAKFYLSIVSNSYLNIGRGGSGGLTYSLSGGFIVGTWYHIAATCDGTTTKLYLNGNEVNSGNIGTNKSALNLGISCRSVNSGGSSYTGTNCYHLNDIRIYDHCLSPKEVKELSKGLVLHYPLNDIPSNNILTDGQSGATNSSYMIKRYTISSPPANNTLCTLTIKMNKIGAGKTWVGIYNSGGSIGLTSFNVSPSESEQILLKTFIWRDSNESITASNTYINTYVGSSSATSESSIAWIKIEVGDTTGSPKSLNPFSHNIIQDCSGYNNNGTVTGTLTTSTDTPRYDKCTLFDGINSIIKGSLSLANDYKYTASFWYKPTTISSGTLWVFAIASGSNHQFGCYVNDYSIVTNTGGVVGASGGYSSFNKPLVANTLYHIVITCDGTNTKVYVDGDLLGTAAKNGTTVGNTFWIGLRPGAPGNYNLSGKLSDFRIYATALSADDVKDLYQEAAFIDHKGNVGCYLFEENVSQYNMLRTTQEALSKKVFENGLNKFSQNNISCTLTDNGFKIYRNPNVTSSIANSSGQSNWGGLVINNTNNWLNLTKTHTYLIEFDIYGVSDRAANDIVWSNNISWSGGGLSPTPSNVVINNPVSATFNEITSQHFSYKFTINDDVYKTCTSSYSSFILGNSYLSYNGFKFGWGYTTTSSVGTEIYINNLRMFDITSNVPTQIDINKQGLIEAFTFTENGDNAFIDSYYGMNSNQLIEI